MMTTEIMMMTMIGIITMMMTMIGITTGITIGTMIIMIMDTIEIILVK
jgi:hypothetical protein